MTLQIHNILFNNKIDINNTSNTNNSNNNQKNIYIPLVYCFINLLYKLLLLMLLLLIYFYFLLFY